MKKQAILFAAFILAAIFSSAQAPEGFNYQAVARNEAGEILANKTISLKIGILRGHTDSKPVYSER